MTKLGNLQTSCIKNSESPSAKSKDCKDLHNSRPDLKNQTVHIFTSTTNSLQRQKKSTRWKREMDEEYTYLRTCYPAYLNDSSKGWCTIRRSGVSENERPKPSSGWGFCSTDDAQAECNGAISSEEENSMPHEMTFLNDEYCLNKLKDNLRVEQPEELNGLQDKVHNSETFCVGQIFEHSFLSENFVDQDRSYEEIDTINPGLKVFQI